MVGGSTYILKNGLSMILINKITNNFVCSYFWIGCLHNQVCCVMKGTNAVTGTVIDTIVMSDHFPVGFAF